MTLTTIGAAFLIGSALGLRFKVLILILVISLAAVGTASIGIAQNEGIGAMMLTIALIAASLQIGYLFGLVIRAVVALLGAEAERGDTEWRPVRNNAPAAFLQG